MLRAETLPQVHDLWFRYDPPVLIVALTWYQTLSKFGKFLYDLLGFSYAGRRESVRSPYRDQLSADTARS